MSKENSPIVEKVQALIAIQGKLSTLSREQKVLLHITLSEVTSALMVKFIDYSPLIHSYATQIVKIHEKIESNATVPQSMLKKADELLLSLFDDASNTFFQNCEIFDEKNHSEEVFFDILHSMIIIKAVMGALDNINNPDYQDHHDYEAFQTHLLELVAQDMEDAIVDITGENLPAAKEFADEVRHLCDYNPTTDDEEEEEEEDVDDDLGEKAFFDFLNQLQGIASGHHAGKQANKQKRAAQKLSPQRPVRMELRIQIKGITHPPVWRKVSLPGHLTFAQLHLVIQEVFGWEQEHLYQFMRLTKKPTKSALFIEPADAEPNPFLDHRTEHLVCERTRLYDVLNPEHPTLEYEYDFGDSWEHTIELEQFVEGEDCKPTVLDGKGKCPPEDCGGSCGYMYLKAVMSDPKHPEHEERKEWLTGWMNYTFAPNQFNLAKAQSRLNQLRLK